MKYLPKIQALAVRKRWSGCLYQLILFIHQMKEVNPDKISEFLFRVEKFQKKVVKDRGVPYHRTTVPKLMRQIEEKTEGTIQIVEDFDHGIYKIMVHPIWFLDEKKSSPKENRIDQNFGNPMFSEEHKKRLFDQQQQDKDIEIIKGFFDKLGMEWSREALLKIWRMAGKKVDDVKDAIDFMLHANTTQSEPIRKPHGWFIRCMERGEYKLFAHQLLYQLPRFSDQLDLMSYITCHLHGDSPLPKLIDSDKKTGLPAPG
ncbi:MAG: hypothetical protein RLZZ574_475 [Cyanobacteriota bacterium]|jgi:hypothetical protein